MTRDPLGALRAPRGRRRGVAAAVVAGGLALAGGGALATIALDRGDAPFPDTPAGAADVRALLARLAPTAGEGAGLGPGFEIVPESVRVVFSRITPAGEYTIWRARTRGRGGALVFSSPASGVQGSYGPGRRLPPGSYVRTLGGASFPGLGGRPGPAGRPAVREVFGRVSPDVERVSAILRDGGRAPVMVESGWFVFTQPFGHPEVVRFVALDAAGRVIARAPSGF